MTEDHRDTKFYEPPHQVGYQLHVVMIPKIARGSCPYGGYTSLPACDTFLYGFKGAPSARRA